MLQCIISEWNCAIELEVMNFGPFYVSSVYLMSLVIWLKGKKKIVHWNRTWAQMIVFRNCIAIFLCSNCEENFRARSLHYIWLKYFNGRTVADAVGNRLIAATSQPNDNERISLVNHCWCILCTATSMSYRDKLFRKTFYSAIRIYSVWICPRYTDFIIKNYVQCYNM